MLTHTSPGLCEEDPGMWLSPYPLIQKKAQKLCQSCPRLLPCLNETLEIEGLMGEQLVGIRGALTPAQRLATTLTPLT